MLTTTEADNLLADNKASLGSLSDNLKDIRQQLNTLNQEILITDITADNAKDIISRIMVIEMNVSDIRYDITDLHDYIHDMQGDYNFDAQSYHKSTLFLEECDHVMTQAEFLSNRNTFLMNAVMDQVNIKQNKIIQTFSVASVALMAPTLVASVYSINTTFPEFDVLGNLSYPYVLTMMIVSALIPLYIFYKKKWLN